MRPLPLVIGGNIFDLTKLLGYLFDYDAATPAAGAITSWADSSGNGNTLTGTATAHASGGPSGLPYVSGNGTSNVLSATFAFAQPCEVFLVAKFDAINAGNDTLIDGHAGNSGRIYGATTSEALFTSDGSNQLLVTLPITTWAVSQVLWNGASGSAIWGGQNAAQASGSGIGVGNPGGVHLFAFGGGGANAQASIARVVGYSRALTATERANVLTSLRSTYGVT